MPIIPWVLDFNADLATKIFYFGTFLYLVFYLILYYFIHIVKRKIFTFEYFIEELE